MSALIQHKVNSLQFFV